MAPADRYFDMNERLERGHDLDVRRGPYERPGRGSAPAVLEQREPAARRVRFDTFQYLAPDCLSVHEKRVNVPVSIREVAARAGVSVATVSNVLNRPEIVAQATRDRGNAAIRELGFVRNESARQLRAGRSRTIGLVVLDVANPFFTDLARGVEDEASKAGLAVILCNSDDQERKEKRYLELLEAHRVQGVLITPVVGAGSRLARLARRRPPVVLVDSRSPSRGQCSVAVDDVLGGDLAVSHLLDAGHEQIAFGGGPPAAMAPSARCSGPGSARPACTCSRPRR